MSQSQNRKRGFTLVELLVVIGLMAFLATVSTGGYFAVTRGMAVRGAIQDTASIIRYAQQACLIDQVPTAVVFYNYRTSNSKTEGASYGRAVAIRMEGRISMIADDGSYYNLSSGAASGSVGKKVLVDEYADWNQSFPILKSEEAKDKSLSLHLYNMESVANGDGYERNNSVMLNGVVVAQGTDGETLVGAKQIGRLGEHDGLDSVLNGQLENWCERRIPGNYHLNMYRWGLPVRGTSGSVDSKWKVGDAYGMEISSFTLPKNYIFGSKAPSKADPEDPSGSRNVLVFTPQMVTGSSRYEFSIQGTITISMLKDTEGKEVSTVGKIDSSILKDQD